MKYFFIRIILMQLFVLVIISSDAQSLPCGNSKIDKQSIQKAIDYEKLHANDKAKILSAPGTVMRVYFHVFRNDDGTQAAATAAQISTEFSTLLSYYAGDGICFQNLGTEFINNTGLNQNFNADNDKTGTGLSAYETPNCINIFYMQKIGGNNKACNPPCGYGGITLSIPDTCTIISNGNVNDGVTVGHEVGHVFGLLHTFETANGYEDIDGSNSSTSADLISDTPADPFAYNGKSCYSASGCNNYTGSCQDPKGKSNFSPPYTNMMSYWYNNPSSGCTTTATVTNGQYTRVSSTISTNTPLQNCTVPSSITVSNISVSSGYYMSSATATLNTSSTVILAGTAKCTLAANTVLLEPGALASPASGGLIRIIPNTCN
ncbi:MAG: hypothetical protein J0H74_16200 [Chitinophagaceae bacterium]|nr:hypothetical protein [Chitinophagaceae bacterium]